MNSVTKSGTNKFTGRVFEYFQDNKLQATDYFLKQEGEKNPDSGSNVFGGSVGGPIIRNKLFYFFNYEGTNSSEAANLNFPAAAAPLAVPYSTTTAFHGPNTFMRFDYHLNGNNQISFRWTREAIITERDSIEDDLAILEAARHENDAGDHVFSASWTSVLNNRMTNELKFGHVRESLLQGPSSSVRQQLEVHRVRRHRPVRRRLAEHPPRLHRRQSQHLRAGPDPRRQHGRLVYVDQVGLGR